MSTEKNKEEKLRLHPRNKNRGRYDIMALVASTPDLEKYVKDNVRGEPSIDFANGGAVRLLNKAILKHYYGIKYWEFPKTNLTPPIPGRADYLHHLADLLAESNGGFMPKGNQVHCLDIGMGASCIYPIIGVKEYGWNFVGSDIDEDSMHTAQEIIEGNSVLLGKVVGRFQKNQENILEGVLNKDELFDLTLCNPPFHASEELALNDARRKVENLTGKRKKNPKLNFGGNSKELIYPGGEYKFIHSKIKESKDFAKNCLWFTSLVSKQSNLKGLNNFLERLEASQVKTIQQDTGNKSSRILAWTFQSKAEHKQWAETRWKA